jgi:hypothetical protein
VDITLQGLQELLDNTEQWDGKKKKMATLLRSGRYANFYSHTVPIAQIKQDTALVRETVLAELKIQQSDTGYNELLKAPSVNSTLFPGCSKKLEKILS